jgi:Transposase DNA-binding
LLRNVRLRGMGRASSKTWAQEIFGSAKFSDRRWRVRLVAMAARAACSLGGKVASVYRNDAERQGAYGLLESADVSADSVAGAMFAATARACREEEFVFCAVDGSSLTLTDHQRTKGFGPIGTRGQGARGLKVMNALAISAKGVPLGLTAQEWWLRLDNVPVGQGKEDRDKRKVTEKETQRWLDAMEHTQQVIARYAPRTRLWFQLDREGDAWPTLQHADASGHWFTIRGSHDRRVLAKDGGRTYLRDAIALEPVVTEYDLTVTAGYKRTARTARMVVRACTLPFDFRDKRTDKHFTKEIGVVLAREEGTVPPGERPIDWLLLTNRPLTSVGEIRQVILGYAQRWRIEDFHRAWKSGACRVEENQLQSPEAVKKWATILAAVAVRVERIKLLSRRESERPATDEFSPLELRALVLLRFGKLGKKKLADGAMPTLGEATTWLAQIGGYTGKSSGGPPGSAVLGRGFEELAVAVRTLEASEDICD